MVGIPKLGLNTMLLTKITVVQNEVALSYHKVRGLYFLTVIFAATVVALLKGNVILQMTVQSMSEFSDSKPGFIYGIEADNCDDGEYAGVKYTYHFNSKSYKANFRTSKPNLGSRN